MKKVSFKLSPGMEEEGLRKNSFFFAMYYKMRV